MRYIIAFLVSALAFFKAIVAGRYLAVSAVLILLLAPLYMQFGMERARAEVVKFEVTDFLVLQGTGLRCYGAFRDSVNTQELCE